MHEIKQAQNYRIVSLTCDVSNVDLVEVKSPEGI